MNYNPYLNAFSENVLNSLSRLGYSRDIERTKKSDLFGWLYSKGLNVNFHVDANCRDANGAGLFRYQILNNNEVLAHRTGFASVTDAEVAAVEMCIEIMSYNDVREGRSSETPCVKKPREIAHQMSVHGFCKGGVREFVSYSDNVTLKKPTKVQYDEFVKRCSEYGGDYCLDAERPFELRTIIVLV